jgi:hypothetical protein
VGLLQGMALCEGLITLPSADAVQALQRHKTRIASPFAE